MKGAGMLVVSLRGVNFRFWSHLGCSDAIVFSRQYILIHFIIWLAPRAGEMKRILCSDWLPEWARWAYLARSGLVHLARSGLPALVPQTNLKPAYIVR